MSETPSMNTDKTEFAISKFFANYTCGQSLMLAYCDSENGVAADTAMKLGSALGSGLGVMGETCGAVMGAILLIASKYGQTDFSDHLAKDTTTMLVQEFIESFKARHEHITCKNLLGIDLSTVEGTKADVENNVSFTICPGFIKSAIEILDDLFESQNG